MTQLTLGFLLAFATTYLSLPAIIRIATVKQLCDVPSERSSHSVTTPTLGGVGIFSGVLLALITFVSFERFPGLQYFIAALLIIFMTGLKDDLEPIPAKKKLVVQLITATIIVYACDMRITSMHGLMGIDTTFPYWLSFMVSVFTMLVITNAFNLIDGINGLSASIGILVSLVLGTWFYLVGQVEFAMVAAITAASYLAYLRYNFSNKRRTFMGDSGSLVLGTLAATLVMRFIAVNETLLPEDPLYFNDIPVVAIGLVIVPLFDTLRVFATRVYRGSSPFTADRRHIHHLLIDAGFTHGWATVTLVLFSLFMIGLVFIGQHYVGQHQLLAIVLSICGLATLYLHRTVKKKNQLALMLNKLSETNTDVRSQEMEKVS